MIQIEAAAKNRYMQAMRHGAAESDPARLVLFLVLVSDDAGLASRIDVILLDLLVGVAAADEARCKEHHPGGWRGKDAADHRGEGAGGIGADEECRKTQDHEARSR